VLVAVKNGTGKTTTIGKLAAKLGEEGNRVSLRLAIPFARRHRSASLGRARWCPRLSGAQGADAAGLAFDAWAKARGDTDVLLIDTADVCRTKQV
jgi:fused signal recognition particle receptor